MPSKFIDVVDYHNFFIQISGTSFQWWNVILFLKTYQYTKNTKSVFLFSNIKKLNKKSVSKGICGFIWDLCKLGFAWGKAIYVRLLGYNNKGGKYYGLWKHARTKTQMALICGPK